MGDGKMFAMSGNDVAVKFRLRGPDDEPLLEVAEFTTLSPLSNPSFSQLKSV